LVKLVEDCEVKEFENWSRSPVLV